MKFAAVESNKKTFVRVRGEDGVEYLSVWKFHDGVPYPKALELAEEVAAYLEALSEHGFEF